MRLVFRTIDYINIKKIAEEEGLSINDLIIDACHLIKSNPNYYTNPKSIMEYNEFECLELAMNENDFNQILKNADFCNLSVEIYIVGIIQAYKGLAFVKR